MSSKSSGFVSYLSGKEPIKGHLEGAAQAHGLFELTISLSLSRGTITCVPTCLVSSFPSSSSTRITSQEFHNKSESFSVWNSVTQEELGVDVQRRQLRWLRYLFGMPSGCFPGDKSHREEKPERKTRDTLPLDWCPSKEVIWRNPLSFTSTNCNANSSVFKFDVHFLLIK